MNSISLLLCFRHVDRDQGALGIKTRAIIKCIVKISHCILCRFTDIRYEQLRSVTSNTPEIAVYVTSNMLLRYEQHVKTLQASPEPYHRFISVL